MSKMPNTMKIGMAAAFLGAIVAFIAMAMAWDGTVDSAPLVGVAMAVAMMFFAVAGSFSTYSPVRKDTVLVLSALAVAFSLIGGIVGALTVVYALALVILGIVCVLIANLPSTKEYVDNNRVI